MTLEIVLDDLFWRFCDAVLAHTMEEISQLQIYKDMVDRMDDPTQQLPLSLSYESVWGCLSSNDFPLEYPTGTSYDPEKDRIYFRSTDCFIFGLRDLYRRGVAVYPHPWLRERLRSYERVVQRIELYIEEDDLLQQLSGIHLTPRGSR